MSPLMQVALMVFIFCYTIFYLLFLAWVSDPRAAKRVPPWAGLWRQTAALLLLVVPWVLVAGWLLLRT